MTLDDGNMDREFQVSILSLMIRDRRLGLTYGEKLQPDDFSGFALQWYAGAISKFIGDYGTVPTFANLKSLLKKEVKRGKLNGKHIPQMAEVFEELNIPPTNVKFLEDQLGEFVRLNAIDAALITIAEARRQHEIEEAEQGLRQLLNELQVGTDLSVGTNFFSVKDTEKRMKYRKASSTDAIPTVTPVDAFLRNGGLNYGELGVILAPPGTGKTFGLIHFAKVAANRGKKVVFLTLEMNDEAITQRFESSVFGLLLDDVPHSSASIARRMAGWWRKNSNRLFIKDFTASRCTVEIIAQYLDNLKETVGVVPDVILIDYADLMEADRKYEKSYEELVAIYKELRRMANARGCCIWTASQPTRRAVKKKVLTLDDFAGAFGKSNVADVVIGLCQTEAEATAEKMRLAIVKNRGGKSKLSVEIETDFSRAQFCVRS